MECVHCKGEISGGAVLCPYYNGAAICQRHCHECKHHYDGLSGTVRCRFYTDKKLLEIARLQAIATAQRAVSERAAARK